MANKRLDRKPQRRREAEQRQAVWDALDDQGKLDKLAERGQLHSASNEAFKVARGLYSSPASS